MAKAGLRDRLLKFMERLPVVDCHSHTTNPWDYEKRDVNLFTLWAYFARDATGILGEDFVTYFDRLSDDNVRWRELKKILAKGSNVTYWRHHLVMFRRLFGFKGSELTDRNWRALNAKIKKTAGTAKWYDKVTRKRCKLVTALRIVTPFDERWDPNYFTPIVRMESVLRMHVTTPETPANRRRKMKKADLAPGIHFLEKGTNTDINGIGDVKTAISRLLVRYKRRGTVGVKFGHAYSRTLLHDKITDRAASRVLNKILHGKPVTPKEVKALQDWGFRQTVAAAGDLNMVVQIHTGVQTNWGHIPDSNPLHLLNVLRDFPGVRFDLFHAGYPYSRELGMLGKHYPNVWLNMCWMYLITTAGSRQILNEWIDLVPQWRLLGFGSDVGTPEFIYGHLVMARECLADVLVEKVRKDYMSEQGARTLARMMLLENPCQLYGIPMPANVPR